MATINLSVPEEVRDWVRSRVESGEFANENDYLSDLIRRDQEAFAPQLSVADVRRSIEESRLENRTTTAEEVFDRLEIRLKALAQHQ